MRQALALYFFLYKLPLCSHTMPYEAPKNGTGWDPRRHLRVDPAKEPFSGEGNTRFDYFQMKAVGGKTLLWAGLSWRNSPYDFATWPVKYEELAPYYDRVEKLIGVTGNYDHHPNVPDGVFLKPLPWNCAAYEIKKGCEKLGPKRYRMITARKAILTDSEENPMNRRKFVALTGTGLTVGALAESLVTSQIANAEQRGAATPNAESRKAKMKVGHQHYSSNEILTLLAAFGVNNICSALPSRKFDQNWSVEGLTKLRERVESFGVKLEMVPLNPESNDDAC